MATKTIKGKRYRVKWLEPICGFQRVLTLRATSKREAVKLVADKYPAKKKHTASLIK